jgi:hypothetical protein
MRRQDLIAEMRVHSTKRAGVRIELVPQAEPGSFRPTGLMETISRAVEDTAGASKNEIRSAVKGRNEYRDLALDRLISEGYIEVVRDGQPHRHYSLRRFREDAEGAPE